MQRSVQQAGQTPVRGCRDRTVPVRIPALCQEPQRSGVLFPKDGMTCATPRGHCVPDSTQRPGCV
eukprot:10622495-Heterocapsa_arctica.AAC.1